MGVETPEGGITIRGLRLLRRYIAMQRATFLVALTGAVLFAAGVVATTVLLGRITDELIVPAFEEGARERAALSSALVALAALVLLRGTALVLRRYFAGLTSFGVQRQLRHQVADAYLQVPVSYHQATPTGELLAHADADIAATAEVINPTPFTTGVLALIVFSLVSLALVDPILLLIALTLFPALTFLNRVYTVRVEQPMARAQDEVGEVFRVVHESIDGALVVKLLGREEAEVERLAVRADALRAARVEVGRLRGMFEPAIDAIPNIAIIVLLAVGAWQVSTGRLAEGELVQAMALFGVLAFPMRVVGFFLEELPRSVVAGQRIDDVLAQPHDPGAAVDPPASLPDGPLGLRFDHVGFGYDGGPEALVDVAFAVAPGEIVALVGSTGAGKTTLCELAVRLMDPDSGQVQVGGVDIAHVDPDALRSAVSLVFQESFLFADAVRENLTLGQDAAAAASDAALVAARADRFVAALPRGMDTHLGERGVTLSGGQRQRLALARALLRRPRVLLLDDATSAVDPRIEAQILRGLPDGVTTLIIAHRLSTIRLADRVVYIVGGRVAAAGTHDELLADPGYLAIVSAYEHSGEGVDEPDPYDAEALA